MDMFKVRDLIRSEYVPRGVFSASDVYSARGGTVPDIPMYAALDEMVKDGELIPAYDPRGPGVNHKTMIYAAFGHGSSAVRISSENEANLSRGSVEEVSSGQYSGMRGFRVGGLIMLKILGTTILVRA